MCGIAGAVTANGRALDRDPASTAQRMVDAIAHRGPDGSGSWGDPEAGVGFGHRRLAIIDLTPTGVQPMHSFDGRYVITYNGEVYNFRELKAELEARGHRFRGTSDTEVMLTAIVEWGPEHAVRRFAGMFAFALFDRRTRTLYLVRDRLGVKPLYWTITQGVLLFGSELRALMAHPLFEKNVDREAISTVVRYSYVPAPRSVFTNVHKLPPGSILTLGAGHDPEIAPYWQLADALKHRGEARLDFDTAVEALDGHLLESVRGRLIADVPVGAFLSGGTDSSAVVALMQKASNRTARTFTIGFVDSAFDESEQAREVARHLGTDHTEVMLEGKDALALVAAVPNWFDEPFADSSQLPTYLVSQMTRGHVTVALSGDGGDELFAGYPKYMWFDRIWRYAQRVPHPLRSAAGRGLAAVPEPMLRGIANAVLDPGRAARIGEKARRLAAALAAPTADAAVSSIDLVGVDDAALVIGATGTLRPAAVSGGEQWLEDQVSRMQARDTVSYLPDDILTKVDRCSMAVALEAREPLLDHRLVEFVWSLPEPVHHGGGPKGLLRALLARYLPQSMIDRPKRGFSVPLADWLRGPLREWAGDLLAPEALRQEGLFDPVRVERLWARHLRGAEDNATGLYNILMVRAWSARWL